MTPARALRLRAARTCVAHHLACALAAGDLPWCAAVRALAVDDPLGATLLGAGRLVRTEDAALVNAVLGQSTFAEDLHLPSLVHPGSVVIPAAMALAEQSALSGKDFLSAVVVGYEVAATLGTAMKTAEFAARGFRPTGVFGPLGAAAAAAYLLRLDRSQTMSALGIAANMASGLREWAHAGSTDVYVHNGLAARNGLLAAAGVTGPASALTGAAGMAVAYSGGADAAPFDGESVVRQVRFKRHPTCSAVQTVAELALSMRRPDLTADRIASVTVHTHHHGKTNPGSFDGVGQLSVADYLDHGSAADLARRVTVAEDPDYTRAYPRTSGARIDVTLVDGRVRTGRLADASPLTASEVDANLRRQLQAGREPEAAATVLRRLDELASLPSTATLAAALRHGVA
ncbi:MAG: hypothetical protein GEV28_18625 [Actinophytocola sp.]|uniref:MmgE/PrpD family protein n=1 Tax=Actinophytocola sp. TaxID=1872138 RepID=UPI001323EB69|nr:MmgE/PrpD family protein [Actinophytocola sp.]MPZ82298.1 hypothetical protein [Actinophytocola sp.]